MYLFQSETETHFQCPECGQRGAVLTKDFDQAIKTSPYVRITCTSCLHKFDPNHRASPEAFASTIATTVDVSELTAAFEEVATPAPADLPIIDDEFGALPTWLRPDHKDDEATEQPKAAENTDKTPDSQALEAIAAFIKADMGDTVISPPAQTAPTKEPKNKADKKKSTKAKDAGEAKVEPASTSTAVPDSVPVAQDAVPILAVDRASFGRQFLSVSWKLLLLAGLAAAGYMAYQQTIQPSQKKTAPIAPPATTAPAIAQSNIRVGEVRHEIITDSYGSAAKVFVQFANTGLRKGTIEGFYIVLLDAQDQTLASWRVTGRGHTLEPNGVHEVSSTLFNPPKNIDRVSIRYPAR